MECSMKDVVYPFIASLWVETMCKKLRLPEELKVTLGVQMMVARWDGNGWEQMYQHEYLEDDVIAWMPLPEKYKADMEIKEC